MAKQNHAMRVIPEPAPGSRAVLIPHDRDVALRGGGAHGYTCGNCGILLMKDLMVEQARSFVVRCGNCGAFNETTQ